MTTKPIPMFCLPYAGGTARAYHRWRRHFPPELEVIPIEIAGRGTRASEPFSGSIHELADDLARQILDRMPRSADSHESADDYVLFGHSMGALAAFEMALAHSEHGLPPPALVVVSGRNPPYLHSGFGAGIPDLPDHDLLKLIDILGGMPAGLFSSLAANYSLARLRADMRIVIDYRLRVADAAVDVPLLVLCGHEDPLVDPDHVAEWARYTRRKCTVRHHNGGHFALFRGNKRPDELIDAIRGMLEFSQIAGGM
jgi:surfactin synthase thioesterase subunit